MSVLLELAARCEAATGPDRELDAEIAYILPWRWNDWEEGDVRIEDRPLEYVKEQMTQSWNSIWRNVPAYTASLDAAQTLVPGGWGWGVNQPNAKAIASGLLKKDTPVMGEVQFGYEQRFVVAAATPALALCAASLRARAALETGGAS